MERYRGIIGLFGVVLLTAALYVFIKYVSCEYYYDVVLTDNEPLFVVRQKIGKRSTVMSRITLSSIIEVVPQTALQKRSHKTPAGYLRYFFIPTMMPELTIRITSVTRYEKSEIVIEASKEFAELLSEYSKEATLVYPNEE